jgi:hypothetical protein
MAVRYAGNNISLYTVAGIALVNNGYDFTFEASNETVDAGLVTRLGKHNQPVKQSGTLRIQFNGIVSGSTRVSHTDVSAFTIGGTSYLNVLREFTLNGSFDQVMQAGIGEKFAKPQVVAKDYEVTIALDVEATDAKTLADMIGGTDFSGVDQAVSITIQGTTITIPMNLFTYSLGVPRYDLQRITLSFNGADPGTGDYPTAPTGTTSLLEKALNAPTTEMAFSFQHVPSGDTAGVRFTGNCVFESFSIQSSDGQLVNEEYSFKTYGTITTAASS